ncbi:MurR/RpiR family transcriptional regulator [Helcococcus kunzii]
MNVDGLQHIESLQTLSRLCNLINDSNYYSSNYRIAKYLLENLYNIQNTLIYDIAEAAYTSRSTVRRFCISLGYDNFSDLKEIFEKDYSGKFIVNDKNIIKSDDQLEYLEEVYKRRIDDIFQVLNKIFNVEVLHVIEDIVEILRKSKNVVLMSSGLQLDKLKEFQTSMARLGKVIHLIKYNKNNDELLCNLTDDDSIFIISWSGKVNHLIKDELTNKKATKYLITLNNEINDDIYNRIFKIDDKFFQGIKDEEMFKDGLNYHTYICLHYVSIFFAKSIQELYIRKDK